MTIIGTRPEIIRLDVIMKKLDQNTVQSFTPVKINYSLEHNSHYMIYTNYSLPK